MQFSKLEREVTGSPLKCTTNSEAMGSPHSVSHKMLSQAYRHGSKTLELDHNSPSKTSLSRLNADASPSPVKFDGGENKDKMMEDEKSNMSPQKFKSPERSSAQSSGKKSVGKSGLPFGKPLEIIKSKY